MDLYRLAEMREENLRRDAEIARLAGRDPGVPRSTGKLRAGLAKGLMRLAARLWPEGALRPLGSAR